MKVRKFVGQNSRETLRMARAELGEEAVVLSSRRTPEGFELLALAKDDIGALVSSSLPAAREASRGISQPPAQPAAQVMQEIRALRGLLEEQSANLAWMHAAQSRPACAAMLRELLCAGFGAPLARRLAEALPRDADGEAARRWMAQALARNLRCSPPQGDPFDRGVCALVGPTGVGKTTTVAKLAARCVVKHGAQALGLVSADAYRIGAQDQLRIYARILGVAVHPAHDAESLGAALAALAGKRLVLIDTTGVGQRDARIGEQTELLERSAVKRFLLLCASSQAETLEEAALAYAGSGLAGALLTKVDEAVLLGGALDVAIRRRLALSHVTNGQRVPEDLHRANAEVLVDRALRRSRPPAFQVGSEESRLLAMARAKSVAQGQRALA
jgi:flagellar biosynthesis protein FlhF